MGTVKIIVATHKQYWMPDDDMYMPLHVGKAIHDDIGIAGDDTGENISAKNANYCELTGLYWGWKNLEADYIGLVHYRRHFSNGQCFGDKKKRVISKEDIDQKLRIADVLLPRQRKYWIETNYSQYAHAHHAVDLDITRVIIAEKYPECLDAFTASMQKDRGHRFNMMVMKYEIFDKYCTWLFDILFELEKRLDISNYSMNDKRVFGFVGERLLDVWLNTYQVTYHDLPYVFMERQNWLVKGWRFVKRKIFGNR